MRALRLLLAVALLAGCAERGQPAPPVQPSGPFAVEDIQLRGPGGEVVPLRVWVAETPEERVLGLMFRTELPDGAGMLFESAQDRDGPFWMKNTVIPLSIGFFSADGELLRTLDMQPCPGDPCPRYYPGVTYRTALEVPLGWFERSGVGAGWRLDR